jgi:hypothetical protein
MAQTFAGFPLYDPRFEQASRRRFFRQNIPALRFANALYCPLGQLPCRGWFLIRREDLDDIDTYSTDLALTINNLTFSGLTVVQSRCVSTGSAGDPDAIYLVLATDARGVLENQWVSFPTDSAYNIRAPAYPQEFYEFSLDAGSPWTWSTMIENLWEQMPLLGAFPGLPATPAGTPEGWWLAGQGAWPALCAILDQVGFAVGCDLTSATPYTIVQPGAADPDQGAAALAYRTLLEDDLEYVDTGSGRVPGLVTVYFHRRNEIYGTEETIRRDTGQWADSVLYEVTLAAPAAFAAAAGTHHIWSDFTVRHDVDGVPLATDVATAAAIATREVDAYFARIYRSTLGSMHRVYATALPFTTGSQVDGVAWRMDFQSGRKGWITEVIRGVWPWADVFATD